MHHFIFLVLWSSRCTIGDHLFLLLLLQVPRVPRCNFIGYCFFNLLCFLAFLGIVCCSIRVTSFWIFLLGPWLLRCCNRFSHLMRWCSWGDYSSGSFLLSSRFSWVTSVCSSLVWIRRCLSMCSLWWLVWFSPVTFCPASLLWPMLLLSVLWFSYTGIYIRISSSSCYITWETAVLFGVTMFSALCLVFFGLVRLQLSSISFCDSWSCWGAFTPLPVWSLGIWGLNMLFL